MNIVNVKGRKVGMITLYTLSTCIWCKKTKKLLKDIGVEYNYIDVDTLTEEEKDKVTAEIEKWNSAVSFPTMVIDNKKAILGFQEEEIMETLGK